MFRRVKSGQKWSPPPARDQNAWSDAADWVARQRNQAVDRGGKDADPDRCLIANRSCDDWERWDVVEIVRPVVTPDDSVDAWASGIPSFYGQVPTGSHGRVAVIVEPAPSCKFAKAIYSGAVRCLINLTDAEHKYVRPVAGSRRLQSTSDAGALGQILWSPAGETGEVYAVVRLSNGSGTDSTSTTTTAAPDLQDPVCSGGPCKWVASAGLTWTLVSGTCGPATTTTGGPTTTGAPTTTTTGCCPELQDGFAPTPTTDAPTTTTAGEPDPTSTTGLPTTTVAPTTTAAPTTTTTPPPCECMYPTFCPTQAGECTYTECGPTGASTEPSCPTTTPAPATTTTCDCNAVTPPAGCTSGCDWVGVPDSGGSGWKWHLTRSGCNDATCPCPEPDGDPECAPVTSTDCVVLPPEPSPGSPPTCYGYCGWTWVDALSQWAKVSDTCTEFAAGCNCYPPAIVSPCVGAGCCSVATPCVQPPQTTTTGEPSPSPEVTGCQYTCYGQSTTAAPTTTTTIGCDEGGCYFRSIGAGVGWLKERDTCPSECGCSFPEAMPTDDCQIVRRPCKAATTTPAPTTTAAPTTTTTPDPTTTTTAAPTTTTGEPTGACCCDYTGSGGGYSCMQGVTQFECQCEPGTSTWYVGQTCAEIACGPTTTAAPTTAPPTTTTIASTTAPPLPPD